MQKKKKNRSSSPDSRKASRSGPRPGAGAKPSERQGAKSGARPSTRPGSRPEAKSSAPSRFGRSSEESYSKRSKDAAQRSPKGDGAEPRSGAPARRPQVSEGRERPGSSAPARVLGQASQQSLAASIIYGKRPVELMLDKCTSLPNPAQTLDALHIMAPADRVPDALLPFVQKATSLGVKVKYTAVAEEFLVPSDLNHQRVALSIRDFPCLEWEDLDEKLAGYSQQAMAARRGCVGVICDQIQDPHNFGAIMRSAAFFGAEFVVFAKDRQAPVSAAVVRTSAGAAAALDLVKVTNISRVLAELKNRGLWIVATDCGSDAVGLADVPHDRPYVLVLGNEEKGVRAEILRAADYRVRIPGGQGTLDSLNASVAAGVALFALNASGASSRPKAP